MLYALFKSVTLNTVTCLFYCDIVAKIVFVSLSYQTSTFISQLFCLFCVVSQTSCLDRHPPTSEGFIDLGT